ncbi:MAG: T9SS type A sorting domain-containing protein [Bacteroidota bacterium]
MKRFFPLVLGLALICLSFINFDETSNSSTEVCNDNAVESFSSEISIASPNTTEDDAAISLIKVCSYHAVPFGNQYSCPGVAADLVIDPNTCTGTVRAAVTVTNLVSNPTPGVSYPLPLGTEPIFFEYTAFGVTQVIGPINSYEYSYDQLDHHLDNYKIYIAEVLLTFDITSVCPAAPSSFFFDARLIDNDGFTYDIGSNASSTDIFYCGIFRESCNYCNTLPPGCTSSIPGRELEYDNVMACGNDCELCTPSKTLTTNESIDLESSDSQHTAIDEDNATNNGESSSLTFVMESGEDITMQTSPNPFSNEINLNFNKKVDLIESLQIIDLTGKSVLQKNRIGLGGNQLNVDTKDITPGAYFCRVVIEDKVLIKKIIKQ